MEIILNFFWLNLSLCLIWQWLKFNGRTYDWHIQIAALTLLIFILFPVISVTDDLVSVQATVEIDSSARKDSLMACAHSPLQLVAALPPAAITGEVMQRFSVGISLHPFTFPVAKLPALSSILSRPPPTA